MRYYIIAAPAMLAMPFPIGTTAGSTSPPPSRAVLPPDGEMIRWCGEEWIVKENSGEEEDER